MVEVRNESRPKVSVVMAAYNAEKYIEEAIQSVINQTMQDWELLVFDDGSSDQTVAIASEMAQKDNRIKVLNNAHNMGVAETRNRGFAMGRGDYIALLDSDDVWHATKLEKQLDLAAATGAQILYSSYTLMGEDKSVEYRDYIVPAETNFEKMLVQNVIGCSTVMISQEIAKNYRFDESFYHEDYVLWMQLLQAGYKAAGVTECLMDYRVMRVSKSSDKKHSAKKRWNIYRKNLQLSVPKSMLCFVRYAIAGVKKYKKR